MRSEVLVQCCALVDEKVDIKCIAGFDVTSVEESLAFLKEEEIGGGCKYGSWRRAGDDLLEDLTFQNVPADSGEIDAEESILIGDHPLLHEVGALSVVAELQLAKAERLGNGLDASTNNTLDLLGSRELCRRGQEIQITRESRTVVEKNKCSS